MARPRKEFPSVVHHKPTGQARVRIGGKDFYLGRFGLRSPSPPAVVQAMVRLQRLTGMRPGEVCSIRPADIDRSGDVWTYRPTDHKSLHKDRSRVVHIGPHALFGTRC